MKRKLFFLSMIIILLLVPGLNQSMPTVNAESKSPVEKEYEIYPQPQNISYYGGSLKVTDTVNLVLEEGLDTYTVDKAKQVLHDNDIDFEVTDSMSSDLTNVLVGIKDSGEIVDQYFTREVNAQDNFDEIDAHNISIKDNVISILGKETDAAFYGLVSLEHILNQSQDNVVSNLLIEDYANTQIRGVIEGYYGIPWGNDNRAELLEFGGQFKANAFVFAPKDDPYHRERWSELYPEDELKGHERLAQLGNETKNRYIWTIAPFQPQSDPITPDNEEEGIAKLIEKFEQLYSVGVRQFGVLGDDVGELPKQTVVHVMQEVSQWAEDKGDVYDFVFVPQGYVLADWGFNAEELNLYDAEFPDDVQIMFTGQNTLSRITQDSIDGFKRKGVEEGERRDPLFWLNWPVNDIDREDYRRLFMGKSEMMEPGVENIVGVLTNPMEESQPSKIAIFGTADYSWNSTDFDADQNWIDSFKYVEPHASEELHEIAKHMSNMDNGGIGGLEESEELKQPIAEFNEAVQSGNEKLIKEKGETLQYLYQNIVNAVDSFIKNASEENLKKEMKPYINGLHDKSQAAVDYIEAIMIAKDAKVGSIAQAQTLLAHANEKHRDSKSYTVTTKTAEFPAVELRAESGMLRINPNVSDLESYALGLIEVYDDVSKDNAHYESIQALTAQDVFRGYETNQFKPWENISREHMAVILSKVNDYQEPENIEETLKKYKDVDSESRYAKEIAMLTVANVFSGDEHGNFNPKETITRQQMATVLVYAMSLDQYDHEESVDINLDNVSLSHKQNVQTLANFELTNQLDDFRPYEPITRAAVATLVYKAQSVAENF